ncbi:MAG: protein translocase subunit SecD [Ruminococcaceae bacterium]|nr:protein translocase subunit SecD [Oscillospiraceae bacterium]
MKAKSITKFAVVCVIIALLAYVAAFGLEIMGKYIPASFDEDFGIKKGFDLAGGSVIVFEPEVEDMDTVTDEDISAAVAALRLRLDSNGLNEATVSEQVTDDQKRLRVEIPAVTDPNEAIEYLGAMASLSFKDPDGNEVLNGTHIEDATVADMEGKVVVQLQFTGEGQSLFAQATANLVGKQLSIYVDGTLISAPNVNEAINSDSCVIEGSFTVDDAKLLANQIKSGTLPFALKPINQSSVGAQLGDDALNKSLMAGGIGLLLVMIFMIVMYRMCGLMADIALVGYISIVAIIINAFEVQLTLPGIAGIILTIGTAVDANVVIFERVKEELKTGKTLRASVDSGFNKAFSAIIDANITTLIAAVVLWYFGTGTIIGFAKTLFIGTLVSMFTAIFVTKFLLRQLVGFGIKNSKLYSA